MTREDTMSILSDREGCGSCRDLVMRYAGELDSSNACFTPSGYPSPLRIPNDGDQPVIIGNFLTYSQYSEIVELLSDRDVLWRLSSADKASVGTAYQLASPAEHDRPSLRLLALLVASKCSELLRDALAHRDELAAQVFPIVMCGNPNTPPRQRPHRDTQRSTKGESLVSLVYYPLINDVLGGDLVGFSVSGNNIVEDFRHKPTHNQLIVMSGKQIHAVEPVWRGFRLSIVINFFEARVNPT